MAPRLIGNGFAKWSKQDLEANVAFMRAFSKELKEEGVFVATEGLGWPDQAKLVRAGADGTPITDGVFPESKEYLAGYWIVDVESPEQAYKIAARASAAPGPEGSREACPSRCAGYDRLFRPRALILDENLYERFVVIGRPLDVPIEHLLREMTPQVLATVLRRFRDFAAAEDAVQEALLAAAMQWPRDGLPENPHAWLTQAAFRRMADQIRSESARRRRENEVALEEAHPAESTDFETSPQEDDTLILLFMCCHPALTPASAIALDVAGVGSLTTAEIAHAFLVPEATMAQRISRARQSVRNSGIPFKLPTPEERTQRLRAVLHVLYLIFNEGYTCSAGRELRRGDLSHEAMRLTRIVHGLQPADTEVAGLLALMVLTDARRLARTNAEGELIPLAQQDSALWDQQQIAEEIALLSATLPKGSVGPYQLQAAIAAVHDEAARAEDTDWPQILAFYDLLRGFSDNPMVALNQAIAAAMVHGATKGLELLDALNADAHLRIITAWTLFEHTCWNSLETARAESGATARRQQDTKPPGAPTIFLTQAARLAEQA